MMIVLNPAGAKPLYQQLYEALCASIRSGETETGTRLPGKRTLAASLAVSVNTVDAAYQMLAAEGYVEARPRSGFVVLPYREVPLPQPARPLPAPEAAKPHWRFDLGTGGVDTSLFPLRSWGRIQKEILYRRPELLRAGQPAGDWELREAIAGYLRSSRGVDCTAREVVVGAGTEYLVGLLARLLQPESIAIENPGYGRARSILENGGVRCVPVEVDGGGLSMQALRRSGASVCYVTPSHQFPTGVTMPAPRRADLLRWAAEKPERVILEDDYDSEFRFDTRPLPSLQGMAGISGQVVYITTFSKSLGPGIRMACMVLPTAMLARFEAQFSLYSCTVSRFEQATLCRFIQDGIFTRHIARLRLVYRARMQKLAESLALAFAGRSIRLEGRHTGPHLLLTLPGPLSEQEMVALAVKAGIHLTGLSQYYAPGTVQSCRASTVVLGYSSLPDGQELPAARLLAACWQ